MYPFIKKYKNRLLIKLNKELYPQDLIKKAKDQEPETIISVTAQNNYYLVELKIDNKTEYFDFLNCLIYLSRNK